MRLSLSAVLLVPLLLASCGRKPAAAPDAIRPVRAVQVGNDAEFQRRWFPGTARANEEADLAFEVGGRLIERPIKVGDKVESGQLLARLDPSDFENAVEAAEARVKRADALRERMEKAAKTGAVSQQDLTDAVAQSDMANAELKIKQKALGDSSLEAPFAGSVAVTYVENFWNVRSKQPVIRLLDTTKIKVVISLPETFISLVPYVKTTRCRFEAFPDKIVEGQIFEIGTEASSTTRTYPVTILMDQPKDITVLPGMTCDVSAGETDMPEGTFAEGYFLPPSALISKEGQKNIVWVVDEATGAVSQQEVENLGMGAYGILVGGLNKGQWVATAGGHFLKDGQKVRILGADAETGGEGK